MDKEKKIERKDYKYYAARQLKAKGDSLWVENEFSTNSTGFSVQPGGIVSTGVWYHRYLHYRGAWWSTSTNENKPFLAQMSEGEVGHMWVSVYYYSYAVSIRCLKNKG